MVGVEGTNGTESRRRDLFYISIPLRHVLCMSNYTNSLEHRLTDTDARVDFRVCTCADIALPVQDHSGVDSAS